MTWLRNFAHDLVAVVGILLALQAPITAYALNLNGPKQYVDLAFGGLGLLATLGSKFVDSNSYTAITVAQPPAPAVLVSAKDPGPAVPPPAAAPGNANTSNVNQTTP